MRGLAGLITAAPIHTGFSKCNRDEENSWLHRNPSNDGHFEGGACNQEKIKFTIGAHSFALYPILKQGERHSKHSLLVFVVLLVTWLHPLKTPVVASVSM
jgi:hypothetical protein